MAAGPVGVKHPAKTFFLLAFILAFLAWILNMIAVFVPFFFAMGKETVTTEHDDDAPENDERIDEAFEYAQKHTPLAEFVRRAALQGPATIDGSIITDVPFFSALFLLFSVLDEDEPLPPQLVTRKAHLEAWATTEGDQRGLLYGLEYLACKKQRTLIKTFEDVLRPLWEMAIVPEEVIQHWVDNEAMCQRFGVPEREVRIIRKSGRKFLAWTQQEED